MPSAQIHGPDGATSPSLHALAAVRPARDRTERVRKRLKRERKSRKAQLRALHQERAEAIAAGDDARLQVSDLLVRTAEAALQELDDTLARMAKGAYGRCEGCGQGIPAGRLKVRPTSRLCLPCQRTAEVAASRRIA